MGATLTIPKLGTVNRKTAVAPLQIPNSLPGWTTPKFVNGTGNIGPLPHASFGGYWGLNYIYTNGQFSKNPANSFNLRGGYQIAGGVVQSFGIFDFYAGPSPTGTKTSPYGGGAAENFAQTYWAQGRNTLYSWRSTSTSGSIWPTYITVASYPLPNIQFSKVIQTALNPDLNYSYATSPPAGGNLFAQGTPVIQEPTNVGANLLIPPATYANVNLGNPQAASSKVSVTPVLDPFHPTPLPYIPPAPTATAYQVKTGPLTTAGALVAAIQGQWGLTFSPLYNMYMGFLNGSGLQLTPLLIQDYLLTQGNNQVITHSITITLSDPTDQADITGFRLGGGWTVMPDGNFLVQSPNTSNIFYIINPTGNGYYKVVMNGPTLAGNWASGGYGVDLNGNFWSFTSVAGQLASTLGFPQPPLFLPFPQVSANWVGCRHNTCAYPWYG